MMLRDRLDQLGLTVPRPAGTFGSYVPARRVGGLIYVAGQLPMKDGKLLAVGPVPSATTVEQAQAAARQCVLNGLGTVLTLDGVSLDDLKSVVRVGVFVQCDARFAEQPKIANAASELLIELFGDAGRHARAAVGVNALPLDASVEVEFLFEAR